MNLPALPSRLHAHARRLTALGCALAVCWLVPSARAQDTAAEAATASSSAGETASANGPLGPVGEIDARLDLVFGASHPEAASLFSASSVLDIRYRLLERISLQGMWGIAYGSYSVDGPVADRNGFGLGNPLLGARYEGLAGELRWSAGAAVVLPTASHGASDAAMAASLAPLARGAWDAWLWAAERFSLVLSGHADTMLAAKWALTVDGALGFMFNTATRDRKTEIYFQVMPAAAYLLSEAWRVGAALRLVFFLATEADDSAQIGVDPFVEYRSGAMFLRAAFLLNLSKPLGFSFDEGRWWGLALQGGTTF